MQEHNPLPRKLGTNVERLRIQQELNKTTFSNMSGISRPTLNKIEGGRMDARLSYIQKLADALCVEPDELLRAPQDGGAEGGFGDMF